MHIYIYICIYIYIIINIIRHVLAIAHVISTVITIHLLLGFLASIWFDDFPVKSQHLELAG